MKVRIGFITSFAAVATLASCSTTHQESVTWEKKKGVTVIHHRSRTSSGLVDRIDALGKNAIVSRAEIHVYDVGRLPHGENGMDEAHRYYRVVQSPRPILSLPKGAPAKGPRTVFTPPNYTPPPQDQRINDAVAEAKRAKEELEAAEKQVQERLNADNNLRGQLQAQIDENERLRAQIEAGMSTKHGDPSAQTDAEKAAAAAVDPLVQWGKQVQQ